jgi:hypothetical protein
MTSNTINGVDRDDLKSLMREILQELLWEMEQQQPDPDQGLEFRPEVADYLRARLADKNRRGTPISDVLSELGLDE